MNRATITPALLQWARERAQQTPEGIATRLNIPLNRYLQWEQGETRPAFGQAMRLAEVLQIPFGYLYLETPPDQETEIPDLRTIESVRDDEPISLELEDLIDEILLKQDWYRDFLVREGVDPLPFVGLFDMESDPEVVALSIRQTLGINSEFHREVRSAEEFLRAFVARVEEAGILVFRSRFVGNNINRRLSLEEFRGFAISDPVAPVIFINALDSESAMNFTLAHELAHIWLAQSGISNPTLRPSTNGHVPESERICNQIAAEVLVPKNEFLNEWQDDLDTELNIRKVRQRFRVSSLVIIRRAFDLGEISKAQFDVWYERFSERIPDQVTSDTEEIRQQRGNFYNTLFVRHSRRFTETVVRAVMSGQERFSEAAMLFSVKSYTIAKIAQRLNVE